MNPTVWRILLSRPGEGATFLLAVAVLIGLAIGLGVWFSLRSHPYRTLLTLVFLLGPLALAAGLGAPDRLRRADCARSGRSVQVGREALIGGPVGVTPILEDIRMADGRAARQTWRLGLERRLVHVNAYCSPLVRDWARADVRERTYGLVWGCGRFGQKWCLPEAP